MTDIELWTQELDFYKKLYKEIDNYNEKNINPIDNTSIENEIIYREHAIDVMKVWYQYTNGKKYLPIGDKNMLCFLLSPYNAIFDIQEDYKRRLPFDAIHFVQNTAKTLLSPFILNCLHKDVLFTLERLPNHFKSHNWCYPWDCIEAIPLFVEALQSDKVKQVIQLLEQYISLFAPKNIKK